MEQTPHFGEVPTYRLPAWLEGLALPTTKDEALDWAEHHGAPQAALDFLETLPAAVFTSDAGLHHALSDLDEAHLRRVHPKESTIAHDGTSS